MNHFFITPNQIKDKKIAITGSDVRHIKNVLRMKAGEEASFSDGVNPFTHHAVLAEISDEIIYFDLIYTQEANQELSARIYLFQSLPKADKMELVIQKAVELGVHEIIPVATARSIVKLDAKKAQAKRQRWQSISEAAAKQCHRQSIPLINGIMNFTDALKWAEKMELRMIPYEMADNMEKTKKSIQSIKSGQTVAIFIGPEGGFSADEIKLAIKAGITPITMGRRILRTETAAFVILSWIMYQLEE